MKERLHILVLDSAPRQAELFYELLAMQGDVFLFQSLEELLSEMDRHSPRVMLFDVTTLQEAPTAHVHRVQELRHRETMGLITDRELEQYLYDLRRWGLVQCLVKTAPVFTNEIANFLRCLAEPLSGFGLARHLTQTVEMYNISINTMPEKNEAVESVINHFASAGFVIHELYDVRLILEEVLNNALFHAFKTPTGEERYSISTFKRLAPGEKIRIEYGNSGEIVGFSVTDNAGSLPIRTIISKLERQYNRDGLFDVSGRGLYLSRMFTSSFIMNIEAGARTQLVALFDGRRRTSRPKPFIVNYTGPDTFDEWCLDPDLD